MSEADIQQLLAVLLLGILLGQVQQVKAYPPLAVVKAHQLDLGQQHPVDAVALHEDVVGHLEVVPDPGGGLLLGDHIHIRLVADDLGLTGVGAAVKQGLVAEHASGVQHHGVAHIALRRTQAHGHPAALDDEDVLAVLLLAIEYMPPEKVPGVPFVGQGTPIQMTHVDPRGVDLAIFAFCHLHLPPVYDFANM